MSAANLCGSRIRQIREEFGWGQSDLAAALNVDFDLNLDQSDISEIERQARGLKDYELDAIARVLNVSLEWLVRGDSKK